MNEDAAKRIELLNYGLGFAAVVAAVFVCTRDQVLGLACGALLGALNFSAVKQIVGAQVDAQKRGVPAKQTLLVFPKMLILVGALAACVFLLPISVPFLAVGFSILMLSIAIETVRFLTSPRPQDGDDFNHTNFDDSGFDDSSFDDSNFNDNSNSKDAN